MLIIFDCDGVLVDSEHLAAQVFSQTLHSVGVNYSVEQCLTRFVGLTLDACFDDLKQQGFVLPDDFGVLLLANETDVFSRELKPVEGVVDVLKQLSVLGIPYCVASNGGLDKVSRSLQITGISDYFDQNVYSAQMVKNGKPSPDLFLYAAESMGVPKEFCIVVEDSAAGVKAAIAAQMTVCCYGGALLAETTGVKRVASMDQLMPLLHLPRVY